MFAVLLPVMRDCSQSMTAFPIFILEFGVTGVEALEAQPDVFQYCFELLLNQTGFLDSHPLCC